MTPLYLALMGLDPATGRPELRPEAGVDFLGGVHDGGAPARISEPAVRNWVLSLASSIVHLLQRPAASIVAAYPKANVEEPEAPAAAPAPPPAEDWAAHEAAHRFPEAHRPRARRGSRQEPAVRAVPVLQASVDDAAVPYTYAQPGFGPDPATLAAFLHYNYPSFSMMNVPARDHTALAHQPPLQVQCIVRCRIPTEDLRGTFYLHYYINNRDGEHHMAIVYGDDLKSASLEVERKGETDFDRVARGASLRANKALTEGDGPDAVVPAPLAEDLPAPLIRIHSACFTGETVGSARCDCAEQLQEAMRQIQKEGRGVIVYLRQEGRGIGLADKMRAYNLQDLGHDTVNANLMLHLPADARTYEIASLILQDLGIDTVRLLTNNPEKIQGLAEGGLKIVETRSMIPMKWKALMVADGAAEEDDEERGHGRAGNRCPSPPELSSALPEFKELDGYLLTKIERMGHRLEVPLAVLSAAKKMPVSATS